MHTYSRSSFGIGAKRFDIPALTGFRFLSAFFVLIGHGYQVVLFDGQASVGAWLGPLASCGMTMFFVLSGFLMWLNYGELYRNRGLLKITREFAIARFARLYPMLLCTLLFTSIIRWKVVLAALPTAIVYLFMMNAWYPGRHGPALITFYVPNVAHTWSISVECFCYLLFPIAALALCRTRSRIVIVGCGLLLLAALLLSAFLLPQDATELRTVFATNVPDAQFVMWLTYYSPITRVFEFGIGCVTAKYFLSARSSSSGLIVSTGLIALAGAIFIFANGDMFATLWALHDLGIRAGLAVGSALLIYGMASAPSHPVSRLLSTKPALMGGEISYSTYLLHPFVLGVFMHRARAPTALLQVSEWLLTMTVSFAAIYFISYVSYRMIEVPARKWIKNYLGNRVVSAGS